MLRPQRLLLLLLLLGHPAVNAQNPPRAAATCTSAKSCAETRFRTKQGGKHPQIAENRSMDLGSAIEPVRVYVYRYCFAPCWHRVNAAVDVMTDQQHSSLGGHTVCASLSAAHGLRISHTPRTSHTQE